GLKKVGLDDTAVNAVMGDNWLRFFEKSFGPEQP
ncbi:MAG: membrane dipeptidase, partial [Proteobacteria bacterium]|nr:membrane dipeptidase [Pseudomonadota bacterium]